MAKEKLDELCASDILEALRFSLSMEGLRSLSDVDLFRMRDILYYWHSLACREVLDRLNNG